MLTQRIAKSVLTVGCQYRPPKGGVAQVLYNYEQFVFPQFKFIANSGGISRSRKLQKAMVGLLMMGYKLTLDRDIRIVHIHTASYNSFRRSSYYVRLAKLFGRKVILHIHGGAFKEYYATNPLWVSSVLDHCDAIITLSRNWEEYFQTIASVPKIFIVDNIIAYPALRPITEDKTMVHLLFLGLIDEQKGIFDLVEALGENLEKVRGKVLLHIGGNGEVNRLNEMIVRLGLEDVVTYEGFVSGDLKNKLLSSCDAFILPSYTEGLPVSVLEAMSYGKPVLSTPVGGIPEVVEDQVNGLLFPPGDKEQMIVSIEQIMDDVDKKRSMGMESYKRIASSFPDSIITKLDYIYRTI